MEEYYDYLELNDYQYKGCWIRIYLEPDWEKNCILYKASIELPSENGVVDSDCYETRELAEFAAEELINSWN